ncbi:aminoglycoside phosphotransferase family protein [Acidobacteria bacterium AB60]|nr:aminoglycoside phosphotransferase family protein [Acidobacteria bacterium AB60]
MDGTLTEPDWPPLTEPEVRDLLLQFPELLPPFRILSVSPRPLSAAAVVLTREARVFVKRHARAVRDAAGVGEEHRFMNHLRQRGAPIPEVFNDIDGRTAVERGDWTYEVQSVPRGVDAYEQAISWTPFQCVEHAKALGQAMARLHQAAEGFDAPPRSGHALVAGFSIYAAADPAAAFDRYVETRPALQEYLAGSGCGAEALDLLTPFHAEMKPLLQDLAPMWTHNDLHPSNVFWSSTDSDAHVTAAIDFGLCDRTNAVHDMAHAIERSIVDWLGLLNHPHEPDRVAIHYDQLWALLEGYESVRRLTQPEAHALAPMLALCHAEFALSETDYFLSALGSKEKAWYACEGYLVLHARWWRSGGAKLLDALRRWAGTRPLSMEGTRA